MIRPILKWVGGKTQILDKILAKIPREMKSYHEPFLGGASVLLGILTLRASGEIRIRGSVVASDVNPHLIALYTNVQRDVAGVVAALRPLATEFAGLPADGQVNRMSATEAEARTSQESYYYWIRAQFNGLAAAERSGAAASAMLIFLNKTCFRGLYRAGPRGFNVPFGHYKNPGILDEAGLREFSAAVQGVQFRLCSWEVALRGVGSGDFVYLDPPYVPETATSFVGYVADGFAAAQHEALFDACYDMTLAENVKFILSNSDVAPVREAFTEEAGFRTEVVSARRAIHSRAPDSRTNEVLVQNY